MELELSFMAFLLALLLYLSQMNHCLEIKALNRKGANLRSLLQ